MRPLLHHDSANRVVGPQDWHVLPVKIRAPAFVPKIGQDYQSSCLHPGFNFESRRCFLPNLGLAATFLRHVNRSFHKCDFARIEIRRLQFAQPLLMVWHHLDPARNEDS